MIKLHVFFTAENKNTNSSGQQKPKIITPQIYVHYFTLMSEHELWNWISIVLIRVHECRELTCWWDEFWILVCQLLSWICCHVKITWSSTSQTWKNIKSWKPPNSRNTLNDLLSASCVSMQLVVQIFSEKIKWNTLESHIFIKLYHPWICCYSTFTFQSFSRHFLPKWLTLRHNQAGMYCNWDQCGKTPGTTSNYQCRAKEKERGGI